MDPEPRSRRSLALARLGFGLGALVGLVEGATLLRAIGPPIDRLCTMLFAIGIDGLALAVPAALIGAALPRSAIGRTGALANALTLAALLLGGGFALAAASWGGPNPTDRPHVLLISIDTLRPDHLSAYGYRRETSPRLEAFARKAVLFEDATSHSTWTLPAHVSMLTGLDPAAHGVLARDQRIQDFHTTLAERLAAEGYATSAWVGTRDWGFVGSLYGFDAGFERFIHYPHARRFRSARLLRGVDEFLFGTLDRSVGNARAQTDAVINWIGMQRQDPFFAFVHFYDVHSKEVDLPYQAPEPFRDMFCPGDLEDIDLCDEGACATDRLLEISRGWKRPLDAREIEVARCLYDGGIAFVDHEIGRLFDALAGWELDANTIVIVTSDHGEAFFEHGLPLHATLHQEITRIPLIISAPGAMAGKRAKGVVRQSDLLPTVLELTGSRPAQQVQGESLVDVLMEWGATRSHDTLAFDESFGSVLLRDERRTLIRHVQARALEGKPVMELYDLESDPAQTRNRADVDPLEVATLQQRMLELERAGESLRAQLGNKTTRESVELSEEARAGLRALGYIDGDIENQGANQTRSDVESENDAK